MTRPARAGSRIWLFRGLLLLFTVAACALAAEVLVFVTCRQHLVLFPRYVTGVDYNGFRIRGNVPNAAYRHRSYDGQWAFRINAEGFRSDVNYAYEKPPGTLRIMTIGDSFTIGYEVAQQESYSAVLERTLRERGVNAEVINAGVSGFGSAEELIFFEQEGYRYDPDILILGFYSNDLIDNVRSDLFRLEREAPVLNRRDYQPAIRQRDFLNAFAPYRWLSDNSYAFNLLNNVATAYLKRTVFDRKLSTVAGDDPDPSRLPEETLAYAETLACALVARLHAVATKHGAPLIVLDVPKRQDLRRSLPARCSPTAVADRYVDAGALLRQEAPGEELYWEHGDNHWTPTSHRIAGTHLADVAQEVLHASGLPHRAVTRAGTASAFGPGAP